MTDRTRPPRPKTRVAPKGDAVKQAQTLVPKIEQAIERADPEALRARLAFTEAQLDVLDQISNGNVPRGAAAVLQAARLRLDFLLSKPATALDVRQQAVVMVHDPYAEPGTAGSVVEVVTKAPVLLKAPGESDADFAERVARQREAELHGDDGQGGDEGDEP